VSVLIWIAVYAAGSLFWSWILFWEGADWLEGSFLSGLLFWYNAPEWSSEGIKVFAACSWFLQTIWFIAGLFSPGIRAFFQS